MSSLAETVRERLREAALLQQKHVALQTAAREKTQQAASQTVHSTPAKELVVASRFDINTAARTLQPGSAEHADVLLRLKLALPQLRGPGAVVPVLRLPGSTPPPGHGVDVWSIASAQGRASFAASASGVAVAECWIRASSLAGSDNSVPQLCARDGRLAFGEGVPVFEGGHIPRAAAVAAGQDALVLVQVAVGTPHWVDDAGLQAFAVPGRADHVHPTLPAPPKGAGSYCVGSDMELRQGDDDDAAAAQGAPTAHRCRYAVCDPDRVLACYVVQLQQGGGGGVPGSSAHAAARGTLSRVSPLAQQRQRRTLSEAASAATADPLSSGGAAFMAPPMSPGGGGSGSTSSKRFDFFDTVDQVPLSLRDKMVGAYAAGAKSANTLIPFKHAHARARQQMERLGSARQAEREEISDMLAQLEQRLAALQARYGTVEQQAHRSLRAALLQVHGLARRAKQLLAADVAPRWEARAHALATAALLRAAATAQLPPRHFIELWEAHRQFGGALAAASEAAAAAQAAPAGLGVRVRGEILYTSGEPQMDEGVSTAPAVAAGALDDAQDGAAASMEQSQPHPAADGAGQYAMATPAAALAAAPASADAAEVAQTAPADPSSGTPAAVAPRRKIGVVEMLLPSHRWSKLELTLDVAGSGVDASARACRIRLRDVAAAGDTTESPPLVEHELLHCGVLKGGGVAAAHSADSFSIVLPAAEGQEGKSAAPVLLRAATPEAATEWVGALTAAMRSARALERRQRGLFAGVSGCAGGGLQQLLLAVIADGGGNSGSNALLDAVCRHAPSQGRETRDLATALTTIFASFGPACAQRVVRAACALEVGATPSFGTLFRSSSLAKALVHQHFKLNGATAFVSASLSRTVHHVCTFPAHCELDPTRMQAQVDNVLAKRQARNGGRAGPVAGSDSDSDGGEGDMTAAELLPELVASNCQNLFRIAKMFLSDILSSARAMPR